MIYFVGGAVKDYILRVKVFPPLEGSSYILDLKESFGGTAANGAFVAARLGAESALVSAVGCDFKGSSYEKHLLEAGVDLRSLMFFEEERTSTAFIVTDEKGKQRNFFYWGASEHFPDLVAKGIPAKKDDFVHVSSGHQAFARITHPHLSFDPGKDVQVYDKQSMEQSLRNARIILPNEFELEKMQKLIGKTTEELFDYGIELIVVTKGCAGSEIITSSEAIKIPAFPIKLVDPTGCGDAYSAAFLVALAQGRELEQCGLFASSVASFVAEAVGPQKGVPTAEQAWKRVEEL